MSGKDQVLNAFTLTPPVWCGDFLGRDQLLPGGVMLDAAAFTTYADVLVTVHYTATQAYAGTGNGTMTGLTTPRTSVAEVFTITLKTVQANAGIFSVVGSVSGAQPDATVAVAYDNGKIAFTINDGSTDFILGDRFTVTVGGTGQAGSTVIPVDALPGAIAPNSTLNFGIPGIIAVTETGAAQNATTITVLPLDRAVPNGATYTVPGDTHKNCPSGTVIGRTLAERNTASPFGPVADGDDEVFIVAFDVPNLDRASDCAVVRPYAGVTVKENFLPNFGNLSGTQQGYVRARYICTLGEA